MKRVNNAKREVPIKRPKNILGCNCDVNVSRILGPKLELKEKSIGTIKGGGCVIVVHLEDATDKVMRIVEKVRVATVTVALMMVPKFENLTRSSCVFRGGLICPEMCTKGCLSIEDFDIPVGKAKPGLV